MEDSELGQDQRALVHSISHARLGEIVKKWHCDALCRGAWTTHGGFGMVADKFWPPRVLPCGHYMCNKCWRKKEKKKKKSHECGDCLRTTSHVEIENAPVPMHIQNFIAFFRDWGMRCDYCSKRQDGVNEQRKPALTVRSRDARVRYPPELIHSYFDINAAEKFTIPPDLGPDPPVSLKKKKNTKHIEEEVAPNRLLLCTFCVLSHDSSLDKRFFSVAQISKPVGDPPRSLTRDIRDLAVKKVFTSKHFKYCKPWYIWMLSPAQMTQFLDEMLACPCGNAYTTGNPPLIFACGHMGCADCEDKILNQSKKCRWKLNGTVCTGAAHLTKSECTPSDVQVLLDLRESEFRSCDECHRLHSLFHFVARPNQSEDDALMCIHCVKGIEQPGRKRTMDLIQL